MAGSGIKAKVLGGFLSSKGLLTGNVVELVTMKMRKKIKTIACLLRVGYTKWDTCCRQRKNVLNGVHYYCFILWIEARCVTAVFCENRQNVVK